MGERTQRTEAARAERECEVLSSDMLRCLTVLVKNRVGVACHEVVRMPI
jgi:hypothetical protein